MKAADTVAVAVDAHARALTQLAAGDVDAAECRLLDAIAVARRVPSAQRSVLLLTNALGVTYTLAGRLEDAQRCYDEVYELLQSSADTSQDDLAGLFHNLAGLAHSRGDAANGILWAQRGIAIRKRLGADAALDLARDLGGLGALQHLAGRLDEARDSYAQAEHAATALLGRDHHEVGVLLANRASLESDAGDTVAAIELYERALTLLSGALGSDHPEVQLILGHLHRLRHARAATPTENHLPTPDRTRNHTPPKGPQP
jgi:tetratricopeptide (TPR) repeat protein